MRLPVGHSCGAHEHDQRFETSQILGLRMRHEHARVLLSDLGLPAVGQLVHISVLEELYGRTGRSPKAGGFACATCDVVVHPVLTRLARPGRKSSPSSYFSPSPRSHREDCARFRSLGVTATRAAGALPAAPARTAIPAVWITAPQSVTNGQAGRHEQHASPHSSSRRARRLEAGSEISQARTGRVEAIARAWLQLSPASRHHQPLRAPWAKDGTYRTAVRELMRLDHTPSDVTGSSIYMAVIDGVHFRDGCCTIRLQSKVRRLGRTGAQEHSNALQVFLPREFGQTPAGRIVVSALKDLGRSCRVGTVFALGQFEWKFVRHGWYSMTVPAEQWIWIPALATANLTEQKQTVARFAADKH